MTSEIMAALMCSPRSKASFDIMLTKTEEDKLWFDLRDETPLQTPQPDEGATKFIVKDPEMMKQMQRLSKEADLVARSFHHLCLEKGSSRSGKDGTGTARRDVLSTICRYKKFEIADYNVI